MKPNNKNNISRRRFLEICGTMVAGGSIVGLGGFFVHKQLTAPAGTPASYPGNKTGSGSGVASPYRRIASFSVPDPIDAFELAGNHLVIATPNAISVYDTDGSLVSNFAIGSHLRDVVVYNDNIYLLFPTRIEVCNPQGEYLRGWEACSDQSDYCFMAVASHGLYVTDASNKNICKYTLEGNFERFIQSPDGFIVPSYSFGITTVGDVVYCSNPGRHRVEKYAPDGSFIGMFGQPGADEGKFCGCCNPVHLVATTTEDIITSEKGIPRVSCYSPDGEFRSVLIDTKALGGGNAAYDIKVMDDKIYVVGGKTVSTFRYDNTLTASTPCSKCAVNCPLRKGLTI